MATGKLCACDHVLEKFALWTDVTPSNIDLHAHGIFGAKAITLSGLRNFKLAYTISGL